MRGTLTPYRDEAVQVLTPQQGAPGTLGSVTTTWTPGATVTASLQPLGIEDAQRYGLTGDRERLRVRVPPGALTQNGRVRARGRDWRVIRCEAWQSYTLTVCEAV